MRTTRLWMAPAACLALVLAGCPGPGAGDGAPGEQAAEGEAPPPGMDFEVTYDTQRVGAADAPSPETGDHDPDD